MSKTLRAPIKSLKRDKRGEGPRPDGVRKGPDSPPAGSFKKKLGRPPKGAVRRRSSRVPDNLRRTSRLSGALKRNQTGKFYVSKYHSDGTLTVNAGTSCVFVAAYTGTAYTDITKSSITVVSADGGDQATGAFEAGTTISSDGTNLTVTWNSDDALGANWTGHVSISARP